MAISFEQVAETAQKYVGLCPVVILGTGASIPHGLPSMSQLAEELVKTVPAPKNGKDESIWETFQKQLNATGDLENALEGVELSGPLLDEVIRATWTVMSERERLVRDAVLADRNHLPLTRLLRHLLRTAQGSVSVITTNYDRLIEYAANAAEAAFFTGFTPGLIGGFITDISSVRCSMKCPGSQGHVFLWKVHGSLDWFENPMKEPVAVLGASAVPSSYRPLIVTPGLTKYRETHRDPFRTVMAKADSTLEQAKAYLCMGYGFNDEHIQPKLVSRLSRNDTPIVVVTKVLSQSGRELLLTRPMKKFLVLEEAAGGTNVYEPNSPGAQLLPGHAVWSLPGFLDMIIGGKEGET